MIFANTGNPLKTANRKQVGHTHFYMPTFALTLKTVVDWIIAATNDIGKPFLAYMWNIVHF